jgi:predicted DNA-binding protein
MSMIRFQMFLPAAVVKALKALAKRTGVSAAEHVRRAIANYLKEPK